MIHKFSNQGAMLLVSLGQRPNTYVKHKLRHSEASSGHEKDDASVEPSYPFFNGFLSFLKGLLILF